MAEKKTIFLTGATGLVGSYLLKILLQKGDKVYVLSRSEHNKKSRERVEDALTFWDKNVISSKGGNLIVLDGDITKKHLGLSKETIDLLTNEIEEIFHSAAVTQFNWPLKNIRKVNVAGTGNVLDLAMRCRSKGRLKKVNHISTAYVCGDYKGIFRESDLDVGQSFSSTYEQSKFEAEKLIESHREKGLWIDIFRPPLVIGESRTGKTITFQQSVYQLLHMLNLEIFERFPGKGLFINIVFVDELCSAILKISSKASSMNKNYHPFNLKAANFETILDTASKLLHFSKPELVSRGKFTESNPTPAQIVLLRYNIFLINNGVILDSKITNTALKNYNFKFSPVNENLFINQLKYCVKNDFLRIRNKI